MRDSFKDIISSKKGKILIICLLVAIPLGAAAGAFFHKKPNTPESQQPTTTKSTTNQTKPKTTTKTPEETKPETTKEESGTPQIVRGDMPSDYQSSAPQPDTQAQEPAQPQYTEPEASEPESDETIEYLPDPDSASTDSGVDPTTE